MSERSSPALELVEQLVVRFGVAGAHGKLEAFFAELSPLELAVLEHDFEGLWARPVQRAPEGAWRSWGALGARGIGKTRMFSEFMTREVMAGRATRIGLAAQNEDKSVEVQIEGDSGLLSVAPPWFRPKWESSNLELTWPNGAQALVFTPESPDPIYGAQFDLAWLSDVHAWQQTTKYRAYANFLFATRIGLARLLWDANPRKGDAVLKALRARNKRAPDKHVIVGGASRDNEANLGAGVIEDWEEEFAGTRKGREDLDGIQTDDNAENATAHEAWIEAARRHMPERLVRRGIAIDPAVSRRRYSDRTAIIDGGVGVDGQGYVLGDYSGKYDPDTWARLAVEKYFAGGCDVLVVERNKGGDLVVRNIRAYAKERKYTVVELGKKERAPGHYAGVIHVREIYSQGSKSDRAQPLSTAYARGRISHVVGVDLSPLEETLTTWEPTPGAPSPDDLDALTSLMMELLELDVELPDPQRAMKGMIEAQSALEHGGGSVDELTKALRELAGGGSGRRGL